MIVEITAEVPKDCEEQFRQALSDADFNLMQALDPKWTAVRMVNEQYG